MAQMTRLCILYKYHLFSCFPVSKLIGSYISFSKSEDVLRYRKNSIKPPRGLLNFRPSRGGLNKEGGLIRERGFFTKSSDKDMFGSFSVL